MIKTPRVGLGAVALAIIVAVTTTAQQPPPTRPPVSPFGQPLLPTPPIPIPWWKSEPFKKELGLTADQVARIETTWLRTKAELRLEWDELSRLETKLSRSRPDRGILRSRGEMVNQAGELVLTVEAANFFGCRPVGD